jgi:Transposase DDE domain
MAPHRHARTSRRQPCAKGGLKRSVATDGPGILLGIASAPGNRHDSPLLAPTLEAAGRQLDGILPGERTCHLDRGYDSTVTRQQADLRDPAPPHPDPFIPVRVSRG